MQYKIPANVSIEDKIVGPLTLRQLIMIAGGVGTSYILFAVLNKRYELNILEYIIIAVPAVLSIAFAMIKVNNVTLTKFALLFAEFSIKPKRRIWDHRGISALVSPDLSDSTAKQVNPEDEVDPIQEKAKKAANLKELARSLDSGSFDHLRDIEHDDVDDAHDDDLVTQAYFGHKQDETGNMYWRTRQAHKKMLDHFASLPVTQIKAGSKEAEDMRQEIAEIKSQEEMRQEIAEIKRETEEASKTKQASQTAAVATQKTTPAKTSKKRPRNRKAAQPARPGSQVNTTQKNQPAQFITNEPEAVQAAPAQTPSPPQKESSPVGELHFEELKKGDIEINLD